SSLSFGVILRPPATTLLPYTTLFRSPKTAGVSTRWPPHLLRRPYGPRKIQPTDCSRHRRRHHIRGRQKIHRNAQRNARRHAHILDRKSTRLNSSHVSISYAVFCLKKK